MEAIAAANHPGAGTSDHRFMLTLGFGTTVAMWFVGYLCRIPPIWVPSWALLLLLLCCVLGGGVLAGRWTRRGWQAGFQVGLVCSLLNMLVLGSLLSGGQANQVVPSALWWVPGSILCGATIGAIGAAIGTVLGGGAAAGSAEPGAFTFNWTAGFAAVAACATLLLLIVGGVVTSEGAGLSVVDWPTSFGYNMFLYPLARMTGGVYFEHAHRLFGSLVGVTTLVLALHLLRVERRRWVRWYGIGALLLVAVQGVLGGLRVTGHFTESTSPADTNPSIALAVIHGITGQLFFGALVALCAFTSSGWRSGRPAPGAPGASADRFLSVFLVCALLVQLVLGAVLRHLSKGLLIHITMATLVTIVTVAAGARAAGLERGLPTLKRLGTALLILLGCQIALGISALAVKNFQGGSEPMPAYQVVIRTAHQGCGAIFLAAAVLLMVWNWRLLRPASDGAD